MKKTKAKKAVMVFRISEGAKKAFTKYANRKRTTMTDILISHIEQVTEIKKAS